jgi:hypothetical protein
MGRHIICCICTYSSEGSSASGFKVGGASVDFYSPCEKLEPVAKCRGYINLVRCAESSIVVLDFLSQSPVNFSVVC